MKVEEKTKEEIERRFSDMGDYVKMDYLSSCLKTNIDFDTRKFVLIKLCGLYELRGMFSNAGKMMSSAADINTTFQSKINDFVKAAELFIRGGNYDDAERAMKKAIASANDKQKVEIKNSVKEFYKTRARSCLQNDKRKQAMEIYQRLLIFELGDDEKVEIKNKLKDLYECLGRV